MNKIKCIIIDDEPIAIAYLQKYVEQIMELSLSGTFQSAKDSYELINNGEVDLIFLDIQMSEMTGIQFIKSLEHAPHVIFTTAYSEYAVEGFELNAVDYLVKPISFERFKQAVQRVSKVVDTQNRKAIDYKKDFIFLKNGYKSEKIDIQDITYIEGNREYATFHTVTGKSYLKYERLKQLEEEFAAHQFIRIHKSFLVNIRYIKNVHGNKITIMDNTIPIGRLYKEKVNELTEASLK